MTPTLVASDARLTQVLDAIGPDVKAALQASLGRIAKEIAADAQARAQAHIRYLGAKKPGSYVASIYGGLSGKKQNGVAGFVRSGHPLAHLMEEGFTISDIMINAKAGEAMKFAGDAGDVFRAAIHRHATRVPAYPAIFPAFEARRSDILAAFDQAARDAGKGV